MPKVVNKYLLVFSGLCLIAHSPCQFAISANEPSEQSKTAQPAEKTRYLKAEPILDSSGSPTRVARPGQDSGAGSQNQNTEGPPLAPAIQTASPAKQIEPAPSTQAGPLPLLEPPPVQAPKEKFPSVGQLEQLMFGHSSPNLIVDNRLDKLETAVFQKKFGDLDTEERIRRLKEVIIGEGTNRSNNSTRQDVSSDPSQEPARDSAYSGQERPAIVFPNYGHYDLNQVLSIQEAEKFALTVLNEVRSQQGLDELAWDELASKMASEHIKDLTEREAVSHQNSQGNNPDVRYTLAGGSDTVVESAILFPDAEHLKPTRQLVVKMLEALFARQDDRQGLLFPHASGFSMAFDWSKSRQKLICCTEVVTKHGQMEQLPLEAQVGDKIEVKGTVNPPYKFHKLTLAWEGQTGPPDDTAESNEALPYFPPLDYEAHAAKSNRDFEKGIRILQIAGITAAIAGGMFIPPVALAAPLIAATVGASTPKPVSEIPVKGGVKTDGTNFSHKLNLNNQGKEGIYYLTVWATSGVPDEILPVSRRAIIARKGQIEKDSASAREPKGEERKNEKDEPEPGN